MSSFFIRFIFIIILSANSLFINASEVAPKEYFQKLVDQSRILLAEPVVDDNKIQELLESHLDIELMAIRALGTKYREVNTEDFTKYMQVYRTLILSMTKNIVKKYYKYDLKIKEVREKLLSDSALKKVWILSTEVGEINAKIDYMIHMKQGKYQVYDIRTEGISLLATQRAEFMSILNTKKYSITDLIENLKLRANY